jgi:hypothetical protein
MNKSLKQKKEVGMKKLVIVALVVFFAMPLLSHAGTVVGRNNWDMQIGGYIAGTVQFSDQNDNAMWGAPYAPAARSAWKENQNDEFGQLSVTPDVRIGFRILGPDTWGAKSQAYLEWDFAAGSGTPNVTTTATGTSVGTNGSARLRHAYLRYDWAKDTILFGNYSSLYRDPGVGLPPGVATVIAEPVMVAGTRNFQLRWEHKWTKEFATKFAAEYGAQDKWLGLGASTGAPSYQTDYTRTNLPFLTGMVRYASDACGKVGPLNLVFTAVGSVGERAYMRTATGDRPYSQTHGYGWLTGFHAQVPIIPERNNSKAGGLVFIGQYEVSQNLTVGLSPTSYLAGQQSAATASANEYSNPRAYIAQGTLNFWLTDTVYTSFIYALNKLDYSDRLENTFTSATSYGTATRKQLFLIALMYQPNPSLVTGIEYARYVADYQARNTLPKGYQHKGISNAIRFGAYYYF